MGFTPVPDEIFDYFDELTGRELKVFLAVMKKTIGWQKPIERITLTAINKLSKISKSHLPSIVRSLVDKKMIARHKYRHSYRYYIVLKGKEVPEMGPNEAKKGPEMGPKGFQNGTVKGPEMGPKGSQNGTKDEGKSGKNKEDTASQEAFIKNINILLLKKATDCLLKQEKDSCEYIKKSKVKEYCIYCPRYIARQSLK